MPFVTFWWIFPARTCCSPPWRAGWAARSSCSYITSAPLPCKCPWDCWPTASTATRPWPDWVFCSRRRPFCCAACPWPCAPGLGTPCSTWAAGWMCSTTAGSAARPWASSSLRAQLGLYFGSLLRADAGPGAWPAAALLAAGLALPSFAGGPDGLSKRQRALAQRLAGGRNRALGALPVFRGGPALPGGHGAGPALALGGGAWPGPDAVHRLGQGCRRVSGGPIGRLAGEPVLPGSGGAAVSSLRLAPAGPLRRCWPST